MHYVYILTSKKDRNLYIGCTKDLQNRFREHNDGRVKSTKDRRPFVLVHYEAFSNQQDAYGREKWLKTGWGKNSMKKMLINTFESLGG